MKSFEELAERFKMTNLRLRHQLELAEACLPPINRQLEQLAQLKLPGDVILLGSVLFEQPYPPGTNRYESCQLYQSALLLPGGLGVLCWDMEEFVGLEKTPDGLESEAFLRFTPLDECGSGIRALLVRDARSLIEQLIRRLPELCR